MATLNLTYNTGAVTLNELNEGLGECFNYPTTAPEPGNAGGMIPNPESMAAFNRRQIGQLIREKFQEGHRRILQRAMVVPDITLD